MARMLPPLVRTRRQPPPLEVVGRPKAPVDLLGVGVVPLSMPDAVETIAGFVAERRPRQVVTVNLDFLRIARSSPRFHGVLNEADLALADGTPLVWSSRLAGERLLERVAGVDLVTHLAERGAEQGWSVYLLGAAPGIAEAASQEMQRRWPGLRVAGVYSPPIGAWDELEEQRIRDRIRSSGADLLLVALGAPRQDLWIHDNLERLGIPVSIGVGCTFDVLAGTAGRAPRWMQRMGLEWLYRLGREPRRLWRRYLQDLPTLGLLLMAALKTRAATALAGRREAGGSA